MPLRNIVITGDPVLHNKAQFVTEINDYIRDLVDDMYLTMDKAPGVGLAAPQVGIPLSIFVFDWEDESGTYRDVAINPELELFDLDQEEPDPDSESEGCLSVPGFYEEVTRPNHIRVKALDRNGQPFELEARDLLAVCIQHEMDHLIGKLFVDYLSVLKRNRIRGKLEKKHKQERAG